MSKIEMQAKESNCIDVGNYGIFKEKGGGGSYSHKFEFFLFVFQILMVVCTFNLTDKNSIFKKGTFLFQHTRW